MTCQQLIEFLGDYLDGELTAEQRRAFDEHLDECSACRRYLDQYKTSVELARSLADRDQKPADLPPELVEAILNSRDSHQP